MEGGEPMTHERRSKYFDELVWYCTTGMAKSDPNGIGKLVLSSFLYELIHTDLTGYKFQEHLPESSFREDMAGNADQDAWVDDVVDAWSEGKLCFDDGGNQTLKASPSIEGDNDVNWYKGESEVWVAINRYAHEKYISLTGRTFATFVMKLAHRGLVGTLAEKDATSKRVMRKALTGNTRMYACRARSSDG